jgi:hypothetical protein
MKPGSLGAPSGDVGCAPAGATQYSASTEMSQARQQAWNRRRSVMAANSFDPAAGDPAAGSLALPAAGDPAAGSLALPAAGSG